MLRLAIFIFSSVSYAMGIHGHQTAVGRFFLNTVTRWLPAVFNPILFFFSPVLSYLS